MSFDISPLLDQWDYQPGQLVVRKFLGKDGLEKIQLRVDLGLLQMNARGRPDGKHPYGRESLLEFYQAQMDKFQKERRGDEKSYRLSGEDCARLQQEALQYHHRYICLFQLEEFEAVLRDTERNLKVFDFVQEHAASEETSWALQQFRPQLLMMRVRARGAIALKANRYRNSVPLRQPHPESSAGSGLAAGFQASAVGLHDGLGNRQPQPGVSAAPRPRLVRAIKPLENARQILRRNSRPGVADAQNHRSALFLAGDPHLAGSWLYSMALSKRLVMT
jgi:hypothetical protein